MGHAFGGGVRHVLAVHGGRQVDRDDVTEGDRAVHPGQGAEPATQRLQLGLDVVVADLDRVHLDLERAQVRKGDLGADVDLGGEGQLLAVLLFGHLDLRLADRLDFRFRDRLSISRGQRLVDDLVQHRLPAEAGLQQLQGRLAGPEPGQPHLPGQLLIGPLEFGLEFCERHLDTDAHPRGGQLLDAALHGCAPRCSFRGR